MAVIKGVLSGDLGASEQTQWAKLTGFTPAFRRCLLGPNRKGFLSFPEGKKFLNSLERSD